MKTFRKDRVSKLILEELNNIINREIEFKDCLVTLTNVEVSSDLESAAVKFSAIPSDKAVEILKILQKMSGRLQHLLLRKINIKPLPRLRFEIDRGLDNATEIERLSLIDQKKQ